MARIDDALRQMEEIRKQLSIATGHDAPPAAAFMPSANPLERGTEKMPEVGRASEAERLFDWEYLMEQEGYWIDFCDECDGPALVTEDSFRCFRCGVELHRKEHRIPSIDEGSALPID